MLGNDRGMAIFRRCQQIWELVSSFFGSSARCFGHDSPVHETVQHRTVLCQALAVVNRAEKLTAGRDVNDLAGQSEQATRSEAVNRDCIWCPWLSCRL
jgi:hypothetical protein